MKPEVYWTDQEDRILEREWRARTTIKRIQEYLPGRTSPAIKNRRATLGLPGRGRKITDSIDFHLRLERRLYHKLRSLAVGRGMAANAYIRRVLAQHCG